jgi:hypothetical protein
MKRVFVYQIVALSFFVFPGIVSADLYDDFNSYSASQTPVTSLGDWRIFEGAVDLVGAGTAYDYFPSSGQGYYIDLVGTGDDPGLLWSPGLFLEAGEYVLDISYKLANNQTNAYDPAEVSVVCTILPDFSGDTALSSNPSLINDLWTNTVASIQSFTTCMGLVTFETNFDLYFYLGFYLNSSPVGNCGPFLDDVDIQANVVPVPGAFLLGSIGFCCANYLLKRKKR